MELNAIFVLLKNDANSNRIYCIKVFFVALASE